MSVSPRRSNRRLPEGRPQGGQVAAVLARRGRRGVGGRAGGQQRRALAGRAVAVDALDLDGGADLAVELGVAVRRPGRSGNRRSASPSPGGCPAGGRARRRAAIRRGRRPPVAPLRHCGLRYRSLSSAGMLTAAIMAAVEASATASPSVVEQVALAVLLEDGAEDPAVAVEVGELRVPAPAGSGRRRAPGTRGSDQMPARGGLVGVRHLRLGEFLGGRDASARAGYISSPSVSSSHHM